jgi:hypothetical protein
MKNNIYVVSIILIILLSLFFIFMQSRNLENYEKYSKNIDITNINPSQPVVKPIFTYNNMYVSACDNQCASIGKGPTGCNMFTSDGDMANNTIGTCNLYTKVDNGKPVYSDKFSLYYM